VTILWDKQRSAAVSRAYPPSTVTGVGEPCRGASHVILILSQTVHESTTEFVMDWLESLGASCLRLNGEDFDGDCGLSLRVSTEGTELRVGDGSGREPLPLDQVRAVWYRRWQRHLRHGAT
jgi:hypothetical protein